MALMNIAYSSFNRSTIKLTKNINVIYHRRRVYYHDYSVFARRYAATENAGVENATCDSKSQGWKMQE